MKTRIHFEVLNLSKNGTKLQEKLCRIVYNKFYDANCSHWCEVPMWIPIHIQFVDRNRHDESDTRGRGPTDCKMSLYE